MPCCCPPARPDIPILVAAKRPRMLELTARHADAWNLAWFGLPDERLAGSAAELMAACARVGRDPATPRDHGRASTSATRTSAIRGEDGPRRRSPATPMRSRPGSPRTPPPGADHVIAALDPSTPESLARFLERSTLTGSQPAGSPA